MSQPRDGADPIIRTRAYPVDATHSDWLAECNKCGLLGSYRRDEIDTACLDHLDHHGVDTSLYRQAQSTEAEVEDLHAPIEGEETVEVTYMPAEPECEDDEDEV